MKKILLLALDGLSTEVLFNEERLENIHRLVDFGCFGHLEPDDYFEDALSATRPIWLQVTRQGKLAVISGALPDNISPKQGLNLRRLDSTLALRGNFNEAIKEIFSEAYDAIQNDSWDCFIFNDDTLNLIHQAQLKGDLDAISLYDYYLQLDSQIGKFLGFLGEDPVVLVLSVRGYNADRKGFFILASSSNPLSGELIGVRPVDLIPTLLELGGYEIPAGLPGKSLISGIDLATPQENELTLDEEAILRERLSGLGYIS